MQKFDRPRYFYCWWCSVRLRGRSHWVMAKEGQETVSVHRNCSKEMTRDGWSPVDETRQELEVGQAEP